MTWTLARPVSTNFLQVYFLFVKPPGMISSLHECLRRIRPLQQGMLRRTCNSNRPSHAVAQGGEPGPLAFRWLRRWLEPLFRRSEEQKAFKQ